MPVRSKAVQTLAAALTGGGLSFNSIMGTVRIGGITGETITQDEYEERYDGAYVAMIEEIDWNRVLLEASARHLELAHEDEGFDGYAVSARGGIIHGAICSECLNEALLSRAAGGWQDWKRNPKAER